MKAKGFTKLSVIFMVLIGAVAATGLGYGLWTQTLNISETVSTGDVTLEYQIAFTDDDGIEDLSLFDDGDDDTGEIFDLYPIESSADPSSGSTTTTPATRYDKDVGKCVATVTTLVSPNDTVSVDKENVYPNYHCTALMTVDNKGSIPVKLEKIELIVAGATPFPVDPSGGLTPVDLTNTDGDGIANDPDPVDQDIEIEFVGIALCTQVDPADVFDLLLHQRILWDIPQTTTLSYDVKLHMAQWNELGDADVSPADGVCDAVGGP